MRFHVVGLPHTITSREYVSCAYTQKVRNFCRMMHSLGHTVFHYGAEGADVECAERVDLVSRYGQSLLVEQYDWKQEGFGRFKFDVALPCWVFWNVRAAEEIRRRMEPGDFLCLIAGVCQQPLAASLPELKAVEYGIGYSGVFAPFKVWESRAWQHTVWGETKQADGCENDTVIPNYFDPEDFPAGNGDGGYYLFIGRLIARKGLALAVEATRQIGARLVIAGQGAKSWDPVRKILTALDGGVYQGAHLDFIGHVDAEQRAKAMGAAIATLAPTRYIEPFGGVIVESQLCGTPGIASDWGGFTETIAAGAGFLCRTPAEFADACLLAPGLDRAAIRRRAVVAWSIHAIKHRYEAYFRRIA